MKDLAFAAGIANTTLDSLGQQEPIENVTPSILSVLRDVLGLTS